MVRKTTTKQADEATRLLADPTRYQIYRSVLVAGEKGMTTAQIAKRFALHRNVARMHLEKLSHAGLLESSLRKTPGGGRPAREYHVGDTVTCQYPPRDYQLLADVALTALDEKEDAGKVARRLGRGIGEQGLARTGIKRGKASRRQLVASFKRIAEEQGMFARFEASTAGTLKIKVLNCIFRELSARHAALVCGLHEQLLKGICESHFGRVGLKKENIVIARGGMSCQYTVKFRS